MDYALLDTLLRSFPDTELQGIKRQYETGRSGAQVLLATFAATAQAGLNGQFVVKVGPENWAEAEERFYKEHRADDVAPMLAQFRGRSGIVTGMCAVAYDVAFGKVFRPQTLAGLIAERASHEIIGSQIERLCAALADWYIAIGHREGARLLDCYALLERLLGRERMDDTAARLSHTLSLHDADAPFLSMEGLARRLPNPLAYLRAAAWLEMRYRLAAPIGPVHGDLHAENVVCDPESDHCPKVLDFAEMVPQGMPLFDLAYLELDLLLRTVPLTSREARLQWLALLEASSRELVPRAQVGWEAGIGLALIQPIRAQVARVVAASEGQDEDFELSWWLAMVAAGLNFARKGGYERTPSERAAALLSAAFGLERLFQRARMATPADPRTMALEWSGIPAEVHRDRPARRPTMTGTSRTRARRDTVGEAVPRHDFYAHIPHVAASQSYIHRSEIMDRVRESLLSSHASVAITSQVQMASRALHGMGGIGKSVIARALCDDPDVRHTFPDGILWVTIGKEPDLITRLRELITVLGGAAAEAVPTLDGLKNSLAQHLKHAACLIILDDVWHAHHARVFQIGGPRCCVLVTTRDTQVAHAIGAQVQPVPLMTHAEAVELLESCAGGALGGVESALTSAIVERLEYLPLAIRLAGAQLRTRPPAQWLRTFSAVQLRLPRSEEVHDSLERTFELSLEELDPTHLKLYFALAIFKEDEVTPEAAVRRLWEGMDGLSEEASRDLLDDLASRALLDLNAAGPTRQISLHDLVRDLLTIRLGTDAKAAHTALMRAYRITRKSAGWHTASDDGYLYDHLVYHLQASDSAGELRRLFADHNWMRARVAQRDYTYDGYLDDLDAVARTIAVADSRHKNTPLAPDEIAEYMRFVQIRANISSFADSYDPALVVGLVVSGTWGTRRALSTAAKVADAEHRARMYAALLGSDRLVPAEIAEARKAAVAAARAIPDRELRGEVFALLAAQLQDDTADEAMDAALRMSDERRQTEVLVALARSWSGTHAERVVRTTLAMADKERRSKVLAALAPRLPAPERERLLHIVLRTNDVGRDLYILQVLAPLLSSESVGKAAEVALTSSTEGRLGELLRALAPHLSGAALEGALSAGARREPSLTPAQVMRLLAQNWKSAHVTRIASEIVAMHDDQLKAMTLETIAPLLTEKAAESALDTALSLPANASRASALLALAARVTASGATHAFQAALNMQGDDLSAQLVVVLAPRLTQDLRHVALEVALAVRDPNARISALLALQEHLSGQQCDSVLRATVLRTGDERLRAQLIAALAGRASQQGIRVALQAALDITSDRWRATALAAIAPRLDAAAREMVVRSALRMQSDDDIHTVLDALPPPHFPMRLLLQLAAKAVERGRNPAPLRALMFVAPRLAGSELMEAVEVALKIDDAVLQEAVLSSLSPQLPSTAAATTLKRVLTLSSAARKIMLVRALERHLDPRMVRRALVTAQRLPDPVQRDATLAALAPYAERSTGQTAAPAHAPAGVRGWMEQAASDPRRPAYRSAPDIPMRPLSSTRASMVRYRPEATPEHRHAGETEEPNRAQIAAMSHAAIALLERPASEYLPQQLGDLLDKLSPRSVNAIIDKLAHLQDEYVRSHRLSALVPHLAPPQVARVVPLALDLFDHRQDATLRALLPLLAADASPAAMGVFEVGSDFETAHDEPPAEMPAAYRLSPQLAERVLWAALTLTAPTRHAGGYGPEDAALLADIIVALAPRLQGSAVARALEVATGFEREGERVRALVSLAPRLSPGQATEAMQVARRLDSSSGRIVTVAALARRLTGSQLVDVLNMALSTDDVEERVRLIEAVGTEWHRLPARDALRAAAAMREPQVLTALLLKILPRLTDDLRSQVLLLAVKLDDEQHREQLLHALAPRLSPTVIEQAVQSAAAPRDRDDTDQDDGDSDGGATDVLGRLLTTLVSHVPALSFERALNASLAAKHQTLLVHALACLARQAGEGALDAIFKFARAVTPHEIQAELLAVLAQRSDGTVLDETIELVLTVQDDRALAECLAAIASRLGPDDLRRAASAAEAIGDSISRAVATSSLAPRLANTERRQALDSALGVVMRAEVEQERVEGLRALAPCLDSAQLARTTEWVCNSMFEDGCRAEALTSLLPHLTGARRSVAEVEALAVVRRMADSGWRIQVYAALLPSLSGPAFTRTQDEALDLVSTMATAWGQATALRTLAPRLSGAQHARAVSLAFALDDPCERAQALAELLSRMGPTAQSGARRLALEAALSADDDSRRALALGTLAGQLTIAERVEAFERAIPRASQPGRARLLSAFAAVAPDSGAFLARLRDELLYCLEALREQARPDVLRFLSDVAIFRPPLLSQGAISTIVLDLIEVCRDWQWA